MASSETCWKWQQQKLYKCTLLAYKLRPPDYINKAAPVSEFRQISQMCCCSHMTDDLNALYINSIGQCAVLKPSVLAHFLSLKCTAHQKARCCHLIKQLPVCSQTNFIWERRYCQSLLCWVCSILTGSDKVRASKQNINSTHILHSHSNPGWLKYSWQDVEAVAKVLLRENIPSWRIARKLTCTNGTHFGYKANLSNDINVKPWIKNVLKFELVIHRKVEVHLKSANLCKGHARSRNIEEVNIYFNIMIWILSRKLE